MFPDFPVTSVTITINIDVSSLDSVDVLVKHFSCVLAFSGIEIFRFSNAHISICAWAAINSYAGFTN